jgi:hypothetical protein
MDETGASRIESAKVTNAGKASNQALKIKTKVPTSDDVVPKDD